MLKELDIVEIKEPEVLALSGIRTSGSNCHEAAEEFLQRYTEGKIEIHTSPVAPTWRVSERRSGEVVLFIPKGISSDSLTRQAVDIIVSTLAKTRALSGPKLYEMDELAKTLRTEISGKE